MSGPGTTETRLTEADGELSSFDPLEETQQRVRVMLSRHPLWVVLVLLFVATAFAVSAALSGVIEDLVSAWFNEKAAPFLARNTIANGWVLLFLIAAFMLIATFLILAIHNYRLGRQLSTRVDEKSRRISELQNVLDNQKRLLDHFQRESALRGKRYERLIAGMREQIVSEREVLSILDMALVLMARSVLDRQESATQARQRFFGVYKRVIQKLFAHPADIRNVCVLEPRGDYLRFGSYCTVPLPEEVEQIAKYYIGDDSSRRHEGGPEGELYGTIESDDGNLEDIDPIYIEVSNRLEDRAPGSDAYIGFHGRVGLSSPFSSYIVVPISRQWGVLRIESLSKDTFGPSQYPLLKQIAKKLELAFSVTSALDIEEGDT